jgi:hypothetical protein
MIPISEKSSGGPLVDWVPERHDRKYTEPAAMSIRLVRKVSRDACAPVKCAGGAAILTIKSLDGDQCRA